MGRPDQESRAYDRTDGYNLRALFLRSAERFSSRDALVVGGRTYTYAELDDLARRWANAILEHVQRPSRVGVFAHKNELAYVGKLAALYAGAAFVPLNRTFPASRNHQIASKADLDIVLVDADSVEQLDQVFPDKSSRPLFLQRHTERQPGAPTIAVDLDHGARLTDLPPLLPDDPAYLLFTSGSTGAPKGVIITHGNILHFVDVMAERYGITPDDRFSQTADQTFDIALFDLFVAWKFGACVIVPRRIDLLAPTVYVDENRLTVWFSVPSVASIAIKKSVLAPNSMPTLRWSLFAGEAFAERVAEAWQIAAPNSVVENLYGPTEVAVVCVLHRWKLNSGIVSPNGIVPIGRPNPGLGVLILDPDTGKPVGAGEPGELCVSGPQVSPGYWRDDANTAAKFVWLPVTEPPTRFYKTGDIVKQLSSGDYAYLGRIDDQVKVVGYRVELGDIEAAIRRFEGVTETAAVPWPVIEGSAHGIVAFVSGNTDSLENLRTHIASTLPSYMVPRRILVIDDFPRNINGKIDRRALREYLDSSNEAIVRVNASY